MSNEKNCTNCNAQIKTNSVFSFNYVQSEEVVVLINKAFDYNNQAYCNSCRPKVEDISYKIDQLTNFINKNIQNIPIVTTHTPKNWDYKAISIVTGQSVIGTGVISEFTSSFSDFFGLSSGTFATKIANGEKDCMLQLRMKTLKLGGNAILATDIDYGELGSVKGMIMVCAAGTAIKMMNPDAIGLKTDIIEDLLTCSEKLEAAIKLKESYK